MAADVVTIFNWAIGALGNRSRIQSPTEDSVEAEACLLYYENVRDQVLRSAPWDCARTYKRLAQQSFNDGADAWTTADPAPGWNRAFALPADFLWPRFLASYGRFELGVTSGNQRVLYTNDVTPILCYTKRQELVGLWDADLQAAVAYALAAHICLKVTGSTDKVRTVTAQAVDKILSARSSAANAPNMQFESVPEGLAARGYGGIAPTAQYIYPSAEFTYGGFSSATTR